MVRQLVDDVSGGILQVKKFEAVACFQFFSGRADLVADAGRDWGQEEKGRTEDEMAG